MKKKTVDILKEMRSLAKQSGGVRPYSWIIKIDSKQRATWTDGSILIRAAIKEVYPEGVYDFKNMAPMQSANYPSSDRFFDDKQERAPEACPGILRTARTIKPYGKGTVAINSDGSFNPFNESKYLVSLYAANVAIQLGLSYCELRHDGTFLISDDDDTIQMVIASLQSTGD